MDVPASHLLTPHEVARAFRVTETTVKTWARDGRFPAVKLPSGEWRFRPEDVAALMAPPEAS